ncbi:MAG: exonuclease SbcCD subunit D [Candidatus Aenigmarchaeota archaeon]|nr:exonuclease SbcCD subunit D [Candidatus Aenigmarchaeota archaeon]
MKFAHLPDCHLGSWSAHADMKEYSLIAFEKSIDVCMQEKVDFILQCGDFFDTSIPGIDVLRRAAAALRKCKEAGIRFYAITGSHDFSPTGKTMMSVLEDAGLLVNIAKGEEHEGKLRLKFTEDKTGAKLAGIIGRKNSLDMEYFRCLDRSIEKDIEPDPGGFKIFAFHAAISEYKPGSMKDMQSMPLSLLPKGFDYYASGHVHKRFEGEYDGSRIVYPGVLFPTSFDELEDYESGFYITENGSMKWVDMQLFGVKAVRINADGMAPHQVEDEMKKGLRDAAGKLVLLRVSGTLKSGKPSDIDFRTAVENAAREGAVALKINRNALTTKEFEEVKTRRASSIEDMESQIIAEHSGQAKIPGFDSASLAKELMHCLMAGKMEDETNAVFWERIIGEAKKVLKI